MYSWPKIILCHILGSWYINSPSDIGSGWQTLLLHSALEHSTIKVVFGLHLFTPTWNLVLPTAALASSVIRVVRIQKVSDYHIKLEFIQIIRFYIC